MFVAMLGLVNLTLLLRLIESQNSTYSFIKPEESELNITVDPILFKYFQLKFTLP